MARRLHPHARGGANRLPDAQVVGETRPRGDRHVDAAVEVQDAGKPADATGYR